jgi:hypothetical protein
MADWHVLVRFADAEDKFIGETAVYAEDLQKMIAATQDHPGLQMLLQLASRANN